MAARKPIILNPENLFIIDEYHAMSGYSETRAYISGFRLLFQKTIGKREWTAFFPLAGEATATAEKPMMAAREAIDKFNHLTYRVSTRGLIPPGQITTAENAIDELRSLLNPGDTLYTIERHVNTSGSRRAITPLIIVPAYIAEGDLFAPVTPSFRYLGYQIGQALDLRQDRVYRSALMIDSSTGMDMHLSLVQDVARVVFGETQALKSSII